MTRTRATRAVVAIRAGAVLMAVDHLYNAAWGLASPASYYRTLPGSDDAGATDPLNRVLVRDLSAGRATLGLLLVVIAIAPSKRLITAVLLAASVSGGLRLLDHLLEDVGDGPMNWVGYAVAVVLPLALLVVNSRSGED